MRGKGALMLFGLGLLAWIVSTIDLRRMLLVVESLNPVGFVWYTTCFIVLMLLRVVRLRLCLNRIGHKMGLNDCYVSTLEPVLLGVVTPGKLGEFIRVGYLHSCGVPLLEAAVLCLLERFVDFAAFCVVGLAGCVYIFGPPLYKDALTSAIILALPVTQLALYFGLRSKRIADAFIRLFLRLIPERYLPQGMASFRAAHDVILRTIGVHLLLALGAIALCMLQIYFLADAFRFAADRIAILFSYTTSTLVSLLPISFAGLGTRDATYIFILGREGIAREQALLFSLFDGIAFPLTAIVTMLLPWWLTRALHRGKKAFIQA